MQTAPHPPPSCVLMVGAPGCPGLDHSLHLPLPSGEHCPGCKQKWTPRKEGSGEGNLGCWREQCRKLLRGAGTGMQWAPCDSGSKPSCWKLWLHLLPWQVPDLLQYFISSCGKWLDNSYCREGGRSSSMGDKSRAHKPMKCLGQI